jgi:hypothetical protein
MKYRRYPYNDVVEKKLEQLPAVDADQLWSGMHAILDKKMPQEEERRRFIGWFLSTKGFLLLAMVSLTFSGSLFLLSKKQNSIAINNSTQNDQVTPSEKTRDLHSTQENTTIDAGATHDQKHNQQIIFAEHAIQNKMITRDNVSHQQEENGKEAAPSHENMPSNQNKKIFSTNEQTKELNHASVTAASNSPEQISAGSKELIGQDSLVATNSFDQKDSLNDTQKQSTGTPANKNRKKEKGFYAGIVSGVDLSSIHFQSMRTGATKGLIVGYAFNKKWSLESGLLWDNKRVYDDGRYFNPAGYTPTAGVTIIAVNGRSRLYELPVSLKYAILSNKHSLFATAGLSSYFMRSENYDYEYVQNSQPGGHNYLSYKNATKNWFSVATVSIGYSHKLGGAGTIRVEPYLKLPIKNIGVGNMPIMSTGLNIGFTKQLTR